MINQLDQVLDRDVPRMMESLPGVSSGVVDSGSAEGLINFMEDGIRCIKHGKMLNICLIIHILMCN